MGKGESGKRIAVELKREIQNGTKISKAIAFIHCCFCYRREGTGGLGKCAVQTKGKKDAHKIQSLLVLLIFSFHFITFLNSNISHLFIIHRSSPPTYVPSFLSLIRLPFTVTSHSKLYSPVIYFSPGRDGNKKKASILNTKGVSFLFGFRFPF